MGKLRPPADRFWEKVQKTDGCWEWLAGTTRHGYGVFHPGGNVHRNIPAHRFSYELHRGAIPEGLHIDHLCRNRRCVRPDHLEVVTVRENVLRGVGRSAQNARKTTCAQGHPFTGHRTRGERFCRQCATEQARERRAARTKGPFQLAEPRILCVASAQLGRRKTRPCGNYAIWNSDRCRFHQPGVHRRIGETNADVAQREYEAEINHAYGEHTTWW